MSIKQAIEALPPLPEPYLRATFATAENTRSVRHGYEMGGYEKTPPLFTEEQMHEYALAALRSMPAEPVGRWKLVPLEPTDLMLTYVHRQAYINALDAAPTPHTAPLSDADTLAKFFAIHAAELEDNPYAYCEVAYTRATGWMAWITDKPLAYVVEDPDRKVLTSGQGDTPAEAARAAIERAVLGREGEQT